LRGMLRNPTDPVVVSSVIGSDSREARRVLLGKGLRPHFDGPTMDSELQEKSPEAGQVVQRRSTVKLNMVETEPT
jgi:beta-lactam-binding protein with PASTA domain